MICVDSRMPFGHAQKVANGKFRSLQKQVYWICIALECRCLPKISLLSRMCPSDWEIMKTQTQKSKKSMLSRVHDMRILLMPTKIRKLSSHKNHRLPCSKLKGTSQIISGGIIIFFDDLLFNHICSFILFS